MNPLTIKYLFLFHTAFEIDAMKGKPAGGDGVTSGLLRENEKLIRFSFLVNTGCG